MTTTTEKRKPKPNLKKKTSKDSLRSFNSTRKKLLDPKAGKLIAVTGGIGTGKTFVLECFRKLGFEVFNADKAVHALLSKTGKAFPQIARLYPDAVTAEGIDRKKLGELVFKDPQKLKLIESILHPLVRDAQVEFMIEVKKHGSKSVVFEVPLLFENNREKHYDFVVSTIAHKNAQKERTLARQGMTEEKFDTIIKKQVEDKIRFKKSDFIIKTTGTVEDTYRQVKALIFTPEFKARKPFLKSKTKTKPKT